MPSVMCLVVLLFHAVSVFGVALLIIHPLSSHGRDGTSLQEKRDRRRRVPRRDRARFRHHRCKKLFSPCGSSIALHCDGLCPSLLLLPLLIRFHICCLGPTDFCFVLRVWTPFEGRPACCVCGGAWCAFIACCSSGGLEALISIDPA